ncbi:phage portal protein [bacterium 1xD42-62]|uniref:Phage portal protein n=1 Tax=Parablautia muri TaxID=2320879 RepID=A0A9X5BG45_9FIRM|nr:phage portal protein [Parablautia muri]NBJ93215.1 phage portal protein [Parablautia muri]
MLTVEEIKYFIDEDAKSRKKKRAAQGMKYYEGEHKIMGSRIFYIDADGKVKEDTIRSNIKISHPFFTELVDQEVQYMLSGGGDFIKSDIQELQEKLNLYFDDGFWSEMYETLTGCIAKGFDYMYAYQTSENRIGFQQADSIGVVEVRAKDTDDKTEHVIYWHIDRIEKGEKTVKRIQVWDAKETYYYIQVNDGKIVEDEDAELNPRPHIVSSNEKGEGFGSCFGFIPFFRIDNNAKQFSGLKPIKDLIDDYDLMACSLSNNLQDFTDAIYVVSGFQGANLDEMMQNIKAKKHIAVSPDGGLDIKTVDIPYEARKAKLELDEKNIYRFGMGFNSAQLGDGNITNVVIRSRYALLDLKCNKLEIRLKGFLRKIIKIVLDEINRNEGTDYRMKDVYFNFVREVITNAKDNAEIELTDAQKEGQMLDNLLKVNNIIDDETIIREVCSVLDIDFEEIKDKLAAGEGETQTVQEMLENITPE